MEKSAKMCGVRKPARGKRRHQRTAYAASVTPKAALRPSAMGRKPTIAMARVPVKQLIGRGNTFITKKIRSWLPTASPDHRHAIWVFPSAPDLSTIRVCRFMQRRLTASPCKVAGNRLSYRARSRPVKVFKSSTGAERRLQASGPLTEKFQRSMWR